MRTITILSLLALLAAATASSGAEPVSVGGNFGMSWLKNLPYQPTASDSGDGLWSWGGVPKGREVVNDTLELVESDLNETGLAGIGWLGEESFGSPAQITYPKTTMDFMFPFYSDDPWILAQHYGRVIRTDLKDIPLGNGENWIPYINDYLRNR